MALLRGVNVGKTKRVPMETLRGLLTGLGCTQVRTLLNSGNAVFQAPGPPSAARAAGLAAALVAALRLELGFEVPVIVKPARDWAAIVGGHPFARASAATPGGAEPDPSRLLVAVSQQPADLQALKCIEALVSAPEGFAVGPAAAYLHCPGGILDSTAAKALLGKMGQAVTTRNWATTLKIQALLQGLGQTPP